MDEKNIENAGFDISVYENKSSGRKFLDIILNVILVILLAFIAFRIIYEPVIVDGHSMDKESRWTGLQRRLTSAI